MKKVLNVIATIFLVLLVIIVIFVFVVRISGDTPNVFGYQVFRVSSGSMEPTLKVGDVILVKRTEPSLIKNGDIITYKGAEGDFRDKIITHKVVEEPVINEYGEYVFQTCGIAKGAIPDPKIKGNQILGVYISTIPLLNYLYSFFLTDYGLVAFIGLIVVLFAYEMISLILSYRHLDEYVAEDDEEETPEEKDKNE
ncbi:MAG: signal peptidase I [Oscillospiraceae bacterium]|nr:signal peptidase I [Candidatus Ruminococcus equi]